MKTVKTTTFWKEKTVNKYGRLEVWKYGSAILINCLTNTSILPYFHTSSLPYLQELKMF